MICSTPSSGYLRLYPLRRLGDDPIIALYKAGARHTTPAARGYALIGVDGRAYNVIRIEAKTAQNARFAAQKLLPRYDEVEIVQAVWRAPHTVWRSVERLRQNRGDNLVVDGVLVSKALSPTDPVDGRLIAERLAGQLQHAERVAVGAQFAQYVDDLKVDWPSLDDRGMSRELGKIRGDLRRMLGGAARDVMPTWTTQVETTLKDVHRATRRTIKQNFLPRVGVSLQQPDYRAVRTIAEQQGWWMRNADGVRSEALTRQARGIVRDGLSKGLGRQEIGANLRRGIPQAWQAMGKNYFNVVASVATSRARSYSEVSGYVNVGIAALEIQAVIDERTTEICRALDGQRIDTHVVSSQIEASFNVSPPEQIKQVSPFLRERFNQKRGVMEIKTANGRHHIADVLRSGKGRVDDRGQHRYYKAGNKLADANVGPPPYHELCRSWTVPVTETVTVPRNQVARGGGRSPVPPRLVPRQSKPRPGVGARPPITAPAPTRANPTTMGRPADPDLYPYTDDFVHPPGVALGDDAAAFQRYQLDPDQRVIRAVGKRARVPAPKDETKHMLDDLAEHLKLSAKTSGVSMHIRDAGAHSLKQVILAESTAADAVRIYSLRTKSGRQLYLRFNPAKKRAAKNAVKRLRRADTSDEINSALSEMKREKYVTVAESPRSVMQEPAPAMAPLKKPPPQRPTVKGSSGTPEPPEPQRPRAGKVNSYDSYGLLDGVPLERQVEERIARETQRIEDYLTSEDVRLRRRGSALGSTVLRRKLAEFFEAETVAVPRVRDIAVCRSSGEVLTRLDEMRLKGRRVEVEPMPRTVAERLWNEAFSYLSRRVRDMTELPELYRVDGANDGAVVTGRVIAVPHHYKGRASLEILFRWAVGMWLATTGSNGDAARIAQARYSYGPELTHPRGYTWVRGRWGDLSCGREPARLLAVVLAADRHRLSTLYGANPEHVGFALAAAKGSFL